jgi:hypothetical protein
MAPLPRALSAESRDDLVVLYGGSGEVGSTTGRFSVLRVSDGTWTRHVPGATGGGDGGEGGGVVVPAGRQQHAMTAALGRVLSFGGRQRGVRASAELLALGGPAQRLGDTEILPGCETRFHFYYIHGILNVCAIWGLSFAATCTAHFGRSWRYWLPVHAALHTTSILVVIVAITVVASIQETHVDRLHKILGTVSLALLLAQASMGAGSALLSGKPNLYRTHRIFGRFLTISSIALVLLGVMALNTSMVFLIAVATWIGTAVTAYITAEIAVRWFKARRSGPGGNYTVQRLDSKDAGPA